MMPVSESPETQTGTTEGSNTLAVDKSCISGLPCAIVKLPETALNGTVIPTNRHRYPLQSLAAPVHGKSIPQVGYAYRMSCETKPNHAVDALLRTSPEGTAPWGLNLFRRGSRTRLSMWGQVLSKTL